MRGGTTHATHEKSRCPSPISKFSFDVCACLSCWTLTNSEFAAGKNLHRSCQRGCSKNQHTLYTTSPRLHSPKKHITDQHQLNITLSHRLMKIITINKENTTTIRTPVHAQRQQRLFFAKFPSSGGVFQKRNPKIKMSPFIFFENRNPPTHFTQISKKQNVSLLTLALCTHKHLQTLKSRTFFLSFKVEPN